MKRRQTTGKRARRSGALRTQGVTPLTRSRPLSFRLADEIARLITKEGWQPNGRVPSERELADAYGVSRTVAREAIKRLEARGIVSVVTGSGTFLRAPDPALVSTSLQTYLQLLRRDYKGIFGQLYEVRLLLEPEIAAFAAERASPDQRGRLHSVCAEMRSRVEAPAELAELDITLHVAIAESAQNVIFSVIVSSLIEPLRQSLIPGWAGYSSYAPRPVEEIFVQHETIVTAVDRRDPAAARRAMADHLKYAGEVLLRYPDAYPPS
jgi:GntR family transcriptional repressor for pyruvate dehydrogenase complex